MDYNKPEKSPNPVKSAAVILQRIWTTLEFDGQEPKWGKMGYNILEKAPKLVKIAAVILQTI